MRWRRRSPGRLGAAEPWLLALVGIAAVACGLQAASGRATPPAYSRYAAERALDRARRADAGAHAPWRLRRADAALADARLEFRRHQLRFYLWRDFTGAREKLRRSEAMAVETEGLARQRLAAERESMRRELEHAACVVGLTASLARTFRFGKQTVEGMRAAKRYLAEAEVFARRQRFDRARLLCQRANVEARSARDRMTDALARFVDGDNVRRWTEQRAHAVRWSAAHSRPALVVNKDEATLAVFVSGRLVATYPVEIGLNHLQRKLRAGDEATPEGIYHVTAKKDRGQTRYHRALELSYPNDDDRRRLARLIDQRVLPPGVTSGDLIEIHGEGGRARDWTLGCVSLDNNAMDDLFDRVAVGTPVTIVGGDGDDGRFSTLAGFLASSGVERACPDD